MVSFAVTGSVKVTGWSSEAPFTRAQKSDWTQKSPMALPARISPSRAAKTAGRCVMLDLS
ncbi:hypothetical protein BGK67_34030 [Streptomyces subrutilus]|uniref:Uncharacterized protein n=1 Tax=Streptomyces subrutilus TaxID=36818 RepID=A0A1E5P0M1_9ACTN|nr:hypothetical protein BGK67_34030 [Streptomyces subrutilus]